MTNQRASDQPIIILIIYLQVLVMYVVQKLETHYPQASKTSIGHVVQLLYRSVIIIMIKVIMLIIN